MKKKILITSFPFESNFGGGEKVALILARNYRKEGVEINFWGSCAVFLKEFRIQKFYTLKAYFVRDLTGIKSLIISPVYILSLLIQALVILPYFRIRRFRTMIMLTFVEQMLITVPARITGIKVYWWNNLPVRESLIRNPFFQVWKFCSKFTTLIVPTKAMYKEYKKIGVDHISVIPNAVEFSVDRNYDQKIFKKNLKKRKNRLNAGMLCRLSPEKGIFDFLKLAKEFPDHDFFIAGKGILLPEIKDFINKNKLRNFRLLGFISPEKVNKYLSTLDIFCVFSEYESFGIVAAEAAYVKIPVLASRVGGVPEVVLENKTGLLFQYGNFKEIKKKFLELADNPHLRRKMGIMGRKHVQKNFLSKHLIRGMNRTLFKNKIY